MPKVIEIRSTKEAASIMPSLDELARQGARVMLAAALEAEVAGYVDAFADERDDDGKRLVVRNGYGRTRNVTLGSGTVEIRAPRIEDRRVDDDGDRLRFTSRILPPYMRRSPKVAEVLPILYLRGLSTGDFRPALESLLGKDAAGLSSTNIARMTAQWEAEYTAFRTRSLADRDYVYVWADGVHFNIRLEDDRLCTLVLIGVRPDGDKELIAVEFATKYPKAVECVRRDQDALLAFFAYPAEHWKHLRTSNVIESPFATVRLRQRVTKGAGSRTKGLLMAFKLLDMAQLRWRKLDGAELLPLVRAGVRFVDGKRVERDDAQVTPQQETKQTKKPNRQPGKIAA
jgi:transposase-like protein